MRELFETAHKVWFRVKSVSDVRFAPDLLGSDDRIVLGSRLAHVRDWADRLLQQLDEPAGNRAPENQPAVCRDTTMDGDTKVRLKELIAGISDLTECLDAEKLLQQRLDELMKAKGGMPRVGAEVKWSHFGRLHAGTVRRRTTRTLVVAEEKTGSLFTVSPELLVDPSRRESATTVTPETRE